MNKGLIPCIADGGMRGLAEELNPNGVNETCNWHTLQRLGLRTRENCLRLFDDAQEEKLDEILTFCDKAKKDMSKKDMTRKNIPCTHARGINSYLDGLELTDDDRLRICKFARPRGWKAQFDDEGSDLSDQEKKTKQNLLASRVKFPKIKVIQSVFCASVILFRASNLILAPQ